MTPIFIDVLDAVYLLEIVTNVWILVIAQRRDTNYSSKRSVCTSHPILNGIYSTLLRLQWSHVPKDTALTNPFHDFDALK